MMLMMVIMIMMMTMTMKVMRLRLRIREMMVRIMRIGMIVGIEGIMRMVSPDSRVVQFWWRHKVQLN